MSAPDFRAALAKIPRGVKYVHHGRNPETGLDCCGLILAVYRLAGLPIDSLDVPYGCRDVVRPHRNRMILQQVMKEFRMLGKGDGTVSWPVTVPGDCRDGDILLIGSVGNENHLGVVISGSLWQMAGVVGVVGGQRQVVDGRLRETSLCRMWAFATSVFRHQSLCDTSKLSRRFDAFASR